MNTAKHNTGSLGSTLFIVIVVHLMVTLQNVKNTYTLQKECKVTNSENYFEKTNLKSQIMIHHLQSMWKNIYQYI